MVCLGGATYIINQHTAIWVFLRVNPFSGTSVQSSLGITWRCSEIILFFVFNPGIFISVNHHTRKRLELLCYIRAVGQLPLPSDPLP